MTFLSEPADSASKEAVAPDPWQVDRLDLDGYLARVGRPAEPPSRAALDALHEAHVRTFTFDNIDVLLDRHPGVGLEQVQAKFIGRGRGGYCFEHGTLFAAALERLGYDVTRRLGRAGDVRAWELSRWREERWELMHTHDELPVHPPDLVSGHHYTSTFPTSHFRHLLMVTRHDEGRHTSLTHRTVTVRRPATPTEHREIDLPELRGFLHELAVPLTPAEEARLLARVEQLRVADGKP